MKVIVIKICDLFLYIIELIFFKIIYKFNRKLERNQKEINIYYSEYLLFRILKLIINILKDLI